MVNIPTIQNDNSRIYTPYNIDLAQFPDLSSKTKYIEQVLSLPENLSAILFDVKVTELIEGELRSRFNLSSGQQQELIRIIRDTVLIASPLKTLLEVIQKKLQVNEVAAKDLTKELVAKVFLAGWEDLKKMNEVKFKNIPEPSKETLPPTNTVLPVPPPPAINPNNVLDLRDKNKL